MGIKPLERKRNFNRSLWIKLSFLILMLLGAYFLFYFRNKTPKRTNSILGTEDVMEKKRGQTEGVMTTIQNDANTLVKNSVDYTQHLANDAINNTKNLVNSVVSQSANTVIGNVVSQIDKLPQQEQEKIKQAICK